MFLHVTSVEYVKSFELRVGFNDGTVKLVDLSADLHGTVFEPLKDPVFFRRVRVNEETNTIEWPNGADLAPEYLHEIGRMDKQVA